MPVTVIDIRPLKSELDGLTFVRDDATELNHIADNSIESISTLSVAEHFGLGGEPTFFVFSDDIAFAKANLPRDMRAVFVEHNDELTSHEDLRLMSKCRHHIIANSTFSWWGAWLNPCPDKIVFAPRYWLLRPDSYFPDLLPPSWQLVDWRSS